MVDVGEEEQTETFVDFGQVTSAENSTQKRVFTWAIATCWNNNTLLEKMVGATDH